MKAAAERRLPEPIALGVPELCALLTCRKSQLYALLEKYPADSPTPFPGSVRMWGPSSQRKWDRDEVLAWWKSLPRQFHPKKPRLSLVDAR